MKTLTTAALLLAGMFVPAAVLAQTDSSIFGITDNSFFVEESFNQDSGVVQNMVLWSRDDDGAWQASVTQEWPLWSHAHQFSYSIPWDGGGVPAHVGQVTLNYRYQLIDEGAGHPAISPRATLILPTGRSADDLDHPGLQINVPVGKEAGHLYLHGNAGFTWIHEGPDAASGRDARAAGPANDRRVNLTSPHIGGSVIWAARPMAQLMLETIAVFEQSIDTTARRSRTTVLTVSPGFRGGWNVGRGQIVLGVGVPITRAASERSVAALGYFSYEGPFTKSR